MLSAPRHSPPPNPPITTTPSQAVAAPDAGRSSRHDQRGAPAPKLVVRYCPHGGSSRGARAFVFEEFAKFAEANPAVECRSELGRGKHPVVRGSYVWGDDKVLDCKNRSSADVLKMAEVLRNSSGRKMLRFEKPVVSEKPSIQGPALGGAPPQVWVLPEKE